MLTRIGLKFKKTARCVCKTSIQTPIHLSKKEKEKKRNANPYKNTSHLPTKQKKKKKNSNPISRSKFRLTQTCDSSLHLHMHTGRTSVFQPIKQTKEKTLYNSENLCSCSAIQKTENFCSSSATTDELEAIPSLLFNNRQFRR